MKRNKVSLGVPKFNAEMKARDYRGLEIGG